MEIIINDSMIIWLLILGVVLLAGMIILGIRAIYVVKHNHIEYMEQEGVTIFNHKMHTEDFISFTNTCVGYLLSYGYLNLENFINSDILRMTSTKDFDLLEDAINTYPIISCKYIGRYRFELQRERMIEKYEQYQQQSGTDEYIVPLFSNEMVHKYKSMFNFSTRYQQFKTVDNIMHNDKLQDNFEMCDKIFIKMQKHANISELDISIGSSNLCVKQTRQHI